MALNILASPMVPGPYLTLVLNPGTEWHGITVHQPTLVKATADEASAARAAGTARYATYAEDGKCHNAEPGTFNHECGKPAVFVGTYPNGQFSSGFCDHCRLHGTEARRHATWQPYVGMPWLRYAGPKLIAPQEINQ